MQVHHPVLECWDDTDELGPFLDNNFLPHFSSFGMMEKAFKKREKSPLIDFKSQTIIFVSGISQILFVVLKTNDGGIFRGLEAAFKIVVFQGFKGFKEF